MKIKASFLLWIIISIFFPAAPLLSQDPVGLVEEDRAFWSELLKDNSIKEKNLLYASYIAYKEKLNDLSTESFRQCMGHNGENDIVKGVASYYIGKNLFLTGKYEESIAQFYYVQNVDMAGFNHIKFAALINMALSYNRLNNREKFKETLQKVISGDMEGKYKKIAIDILAKPN